MSQATSLQENLESLLSHSNPPMRQRRQRTNFNEETIAALDVYFSKNPYPDINEREAIAKELKTNEDRIQVWFQNKRARYRKKMTKEPKKDESASISKKNSCNKKSKSQPKTPINSPSIATSNNSLSTYSQSTPSYSMDKVQQISINDSFNDSAYSSFNHSLTSSFHESSRTYLQNFNLNSCHQFHHSTIYNYSSPVNNHFMNYNTTNYINDASNIYLNNTNTQKIAKPFFRPFE